MHTVYTRPGSGGFIAEAALAMVGLPYTCARVERGGPYDPAFEAISPLRQIPALVLPDGRSMTESAAICLHLCDTHPEAGLGPQPGAPDRADFLRWMLFMSSALYPALLRYFYAPRYTTDPNGAEAVKQAALDECDRLFKILDDALEGRDWLVGDRRTIADVYLLMLAHWHPEGDKPRPEWKNIVRLCETLKPDPVIAGLNGTHRLW
jgi:glutathione S-transferase